MDKQQSKAAEYPRPMPPLNRSTCWNMTQRRLPRLAKNQTDLQFGRAYLQGIVAEKLSLIIELKRWTALSMP